MARINETHPRTGRSQPSVLAVALLVASACGGTVRSPNDIAGSGAAVTDDDTSGTGDTTDTPSSPVVPTVTVPATSITASQLAVIVNDQDAQSVAVADYYVSARAIPSENVITVSFTPGAAVMASDDFTPMYEDVVAALPEGIRAFAITWTKPYRVGTMSVTSAFALGYDAKYTKTTSGTCGSTASVATYDGDTSDWQTLGVRPAMMLAGANAEDVIALIDRGVSADATFPHGSSWLMRTTDTARSVRWTQFASVQADWSASSFLTVDVVDNSDGSGSNYITGETDVVFYFQGLSSVPQLDTNTYVPGAIADHLTSYGGQVPTSGQMSVVRWLQAGATGSSGTVVEPCNYTQKFSNIGVVMRHYTRGEALLEAYWKSIAWPGEALFVGEPLARPWGTKVEATAEAIHIQSTALLPGNTYELVVKGEAEGESVVWTETISEEEGPVVETVIDVAVEGGEYELRGRE